MMQRSDTESQIQDLDSTVIKDIESSLHSLIVIGRKIADSEYKNPLQIQTEQTYSLRQALQNEFQHLILIATSLGSNKAIKEIPIADSIVKTIFNLTQDDFILSEFEFMLEWQETENIHKLERLLLSAHDT